MARTCCRYQAVVTSRTPSSPIRVAPIHGERRKGTSRRGYYRAQFESVPESS